MELWLQSDASTDAAIERFEDRFGPPSAPRSSARPAEAAPPSTRAVARYTRSGWCRSACPTAAVSRSRYAMKFCSEIFTLFAMTPSHGSQTLRQLSNTVVLIKKRGCTGRRSNESRLERDGLDRSILRFSGVREPTASVRRDRTDSQCFIPSLHLATLATEVRYFSIHCPAGPRLCSEM